MTPPSLYDSYMGDRIALMHCARVIYFLNSRTMQPTPRSVDARSIFVRSNFSGNPKKTSKLALFDLDDTLIKHPNHQKISDESEWEFLYKNTCSRLREVDREGYFIGIISNQLELESYRKSFEQKLDRFLSRLGVRVLFIGVTRNDYFRKPLPGTFEYLKEKYFPEIDPRSFYVGDAAGRTSESANDHSCCDIKFAYNCGLRFYTPEAFFGNEKNEGTLVVFDPRIYTGATDFRASKMFVVVFGQGKHSGKTFFATKYLHGYKVMRGVSGLVTCLCKKVAFLDIQRFHDMASLIKRYGKNAIECVLLDYSPSVTHYLRMFSRITGRASKHKFANHDFKSLFASVSRSGSRAEQDERLKKVFFAKFGVELSVVDFSFDSTGYTAFENKISRLLL